MKVIALIFSFLLTLSCGELLNSESDNANDEGNESNELSQDEDPTNPDGFPEGAKIKVSDFKLSTFFQEQLQAQLLDENKNEGLYLGEIEIVAYMHRPGEELQAGQGWGGEGWSHWVVLQSGHEKARDHVLKRGAKLDISELNAKYEESSRPSQEFMRTVKEFRIDLFEVNIDAAGVLYDGGYFGPKFTVSESNRDSLYKFPEYENYEKKDADVRFPGVDEARGGAINVFFARKDWFPEPVTVSFDEESNTILSSNKNLSDEQKERIKDMVANGTNRRFYSNLVFIPFDGPVSIKFPELDGNGEFDPLNPTPGSEEELEDEPTNTAGANLTDDKNEPHVYEAFNVNIVINFDLSDMVDVESSDFNAERPKVNFKLDENGMPFKLNVQFFEKFEIDSE